MFLKREMQASVGHIKEKVEVEVMRSQAKAC
jgi:hypothetical protein